MSYLGRVKRLVESLRGDGLNGALLRSPANIFYFTGYRGAGYFLVPVDGIPTLYVSPLNFELAEESVPGDIQVIKLEQGSDIHRVFELIPENLKTRIGFDAMEAEDYLRISGQLAGSMMPISQHIWTLRMVKDESEIEKIRRACEISSKCMELASELLGEGLTEYEVKSEILREMLSLGGDGPAFDPIVASGPNSSKPHGAYKNRMIERGDVVVIDLGVIYEGYCSDITRTFYLGSGSNEVSRVHQAVLEAKRRAEGLIRIGVKVSDIYHAAHEVLALVGYADYFLHALGHGIGIEIHEPPRLFRDSKEILTEGMMITVEPGVYIPKRFGVRIEDTILVRRDGIEKLTSAPYELSLG
jgi:Xaa-Pro aminopeptidase